MNALQEVEIPGFELSPLEQVRDIAIRAEKKVDNLRRGMFSRYDCMEKEIDELRKRTESLERLLIDTQSEKKIVYV